MTDANEINREVARDVLLRRAMGGIMPNSDDVVVYASRPIASDDRLAGWIANDMLALAMLVDEAPEAAFADRRVSAALDDLTGSLEAAKRATKRSPVDRSQRPHR